MRRRLLTVASLIALLVCLSAAALRFGLGNENVVLRKLDRDAPRSDWGCWAGRGGVVLSSFRPQVPPRVVGHYDNRTNREVDPGYYGRLEAAARTTNFGLWGFEISRNAPFCVGGMDDITLQGYATQVILPWWLVFAAAAPLPLWRLLTFRRQEPSNPQPLTIPKRAVPASARPIPLRGAPKTTFRLAKPGADIMMAVRCHAGSSGLLFGHKKVC